MRKSPAAQREKNDRGGEVAAFLAAARALSENRVFADAARAILGACKAILRANGGFVALCKAGGKNLEAVARDSGDVELDPADLPPPLRLLAARAREGGRAVFDNHLSSRHAKKSAPPRRSVAKSALFVPILAAGKVAGLIGLLDKPRGFTAADSRLAEVFAEMTAVAVLRSRAITGLEKNRNALQSEVRDAATRLSQAEGNFRTLVESLPDVVARFDRELRHLHVTSAVHSITGAPLTDYVGRTNRELGMPSELVEPWDAGLRKVFATGRLERLELTFPAAAGARHFDCRILPERDGDGAVLSALSVARDVTDLRLAYDAAERSRHVADALREATVALTRSLDRETVLTTLLDRMRQIVPFDRASVMLVEEPSRVSVLAVFDGQRIVPLRPEAQLHFDPTEHPIVHGILTTGTAALIPDLRSHPGWSLPADPSSEASWLGVPLFARGDVAGLFSLSKREPGYFNQEHLRLAEAMSSQASVAVENAVLFGQMQASKMRMQSLSRRLVEVQESERRHIARELHDEAGQGLVSLRYGLRLLEREIDAGGGGSERMSDLVQMTDAVIDSLHRLAADLRPASLDHLGLEAVLRQYSRSAGAKFGLAVRFKARGFRGDRLPIVVETALYRVVQEAMTNVVRHARATRVDVLVQCRGDRVIVMVEDDGVGFKPNEVRSGDHFGLLGMEERAQALGGTLMVESAPGEGTTLVVEVSSADPSPDR